MKQMLRVCFVLAVLMMALMPVMAQSDGDVVTIPDGSVLIPEPVVIGVVVVFVLMLMVLGGSIVALFRSSPPGIQLLVGEFVQPLYRFFDKLSTNSENKIDDAGMDYIERWLINRGFIPAQPTFPPQIPIDPSPFQSSIGQLSERKPGEYGFTESTK